MEEVIVLQLTLEAKDDVYLLVSGCRMNNSDTFFLKQGKSVGRIMDLSDI